jgi:hypothetical protein
LSQSEVRPSRQKKHAPGDRERHHHPVALGQVADPTAELDDLAHELVAQDVAGAHRRDQAVPEMQVGAADGRGRHADDGISRIEDLGVRDVLDAHVARAVPANRAHA